MHLIKILRVINFYEIDQLFKDGGWGYEYWHMISCCLAPDEDTVAATKGLGEIFQMQTRPYHPISTKGCGLGKALVVQGRIFTKTVLKVAQPSTYHYCLKYKLKNFHFSIFHLRNLITRRWEFFHHPLSVLILGKDKQKPTRGGGVDFPCRRIHLLFQIRDR